MEGNLVLVEAGLARKHDGLGWADGERGRNILAAGIEGDDVGLTAEAALIDHRIGLADIAQQLPVAIVAERLRRMAEGSQLAHEIQHGIWIGLLSLYCQFAVFCIHGEVELIGCASRETCRLIVLPLHRSAASP